jgi:O-antigen ligase
MAKAATRFQSPTRLVMMIAPAAIVLAGMGVARNPVWLMVALAGLLVVVLSPSLEASYQLGLVLLLALLPVHALLLDLGFPPWWKEVLALGLALMAILQPQALLRDGVSWLVVVFALAVLATGLLHSRLGLYDVYPYLAFMPLALTLPIFVTHKRQLRKFAVAFVGSSLINAVIVIVARLQNADLVQLSSIHTTFGRSVRPASFAGPNLITATLLGLVGAGLVCQLIFGVRRRWLGHVALTTLVVGGAVASLARTAVLGIVLGVAVGLAMAMFHGGIMRFPNRVLGGVAFLLVLAGFASLALASDSVYGQRFLSFESNEASTTHRVERWGQALSAASDNPFLGNGPGALGLSALRHDLGQLDYIPDTHKTAYAESNWLKVLAELGVVGALLALWLILKAFSSLWSAGRHSAEALVCFAILTVLFLQGAVAFTMETYIAAALFWILIGAAAFFAQTTETVHRGDDDGGGATTFDRPLLAAKA